MPFNTSTSILTELIIFGIYFCSIMTTTFGHAFQAVGPGPGPGPDPGPGPIQVQVRGPQKVPGPDLDRTLDSLAISIFFEVNVM